MVYFRFISPYRVSDESFHLQISYVFNGSLGALAEFSSFYVTNEMVKSICNAICTIPMDYLISNNLKPLFHSEDHQSTLPENIQTVFNHLYRLLCLTPNRSLQYSSYCLLNRLLPHVSSTLIKASNDEEIAEDNKTCCLPGSMLEALNRTENAIKQLVSENDIAEEHLLDDNDHEMISQSSSSTVKTDKEHIIIGELLNYKLLLNIINSYESVEQRYTYKLMLQEKKLVDRFLSIVLGLIPANPVYNDPLSMQVSSITKKFSHSKSMFENDIHLNPAGKLISSKFHHIYKSMLKYVVKIRMLTIKNLLNLSPKRERVTSSRRNIKKNRILIIRFSLETKRYTTLSSSSGALFHHVT